MKLSQFPWFQHFVSDLDCTIEGPSTPSLVVFALTSMSSEFDIR